MIRYLNHDKNRRINLVQNPEHGNNLVIGLVENGIDALLEVVVCLLDPSEARELGHGPFGDNTDLGKETHEVISVASLHLRNDANISLRFLQHQFAFELKNIRLLVLIQKVFICVQGGIECSEEQAERGQALLAINNLKLRCIDRIRRGVDTDDRAKEVPVIVFS